MVKVRSARFEQRHDVLVVESVVDVASVAPVAHDSGRAEEPQRLADSGVGCVECRGDVANAEFAMIKQQIEDLHAARVTE